MGMHWACAKVLSSPSLLGGVGGNDDAGQEELYTRRPARIYLINSRLPSNERESPATLPFAILPAPSALSSLWAATQSVPLYPYPSSSLDANTSPFRGFTALHDVATRLILARGDVHGHASAKYVQRYIVTVIISISSDDPIYGCEGVVEGSS